MTVRVTRTAVEVLATNPNVGASAVVRSSRAAIEVLANAPGNIPDLRASRTAIEVLADNPFAGSGASALLTRVAIEVMASAPAEKVRVSRTAIEVLASRRFVAQGQQGLSAATSFFVANWANSVDLETSYQTAVQKNPTTGGESRKGLVSSPQRVLTPEFDLDEGTNLRHLLWQLLLAADEETFIPVYCDTSRVTAEASSSFIPCDTSYRRFRKGAKVVLAVYRAGAVESFLFLTVAKIQGDGLQVEESFSAVPASGAIVAPMMKCQVGLASEIEFTSQASLSSSPSLSEVEGPQSLGPLGDWPPGGYEIHEGLSVFSKETNWADGVTISIRRDGEQKREGRGTSTSKYGQVPVLGQDFSFVSETRREAWDVLRFLDGHRGRMRSFWLVGSNKLFDIVSLATSSITVDALAPVGSSVASFLRYVGLRKKDGTSVIRKLSGIVDNGSTWVLNLEETLPLGLVLSDVSRLSWATKARNASDSYSESWRTLEVCEISFEAQGIEKEEDFTAPSFLSDTQVQLGSENLFVVSSGPSIVVE